MDNTWFNGNKSNRCFNQQTIILKDIKFMQGPNWNTDHFLVTVKQTENNENKPEMETRKTG